MAPHASSKCENASDSNVTSNSPDMLIAAEGSPVQRQRDFFPFLDLPGELRNRVYDILAADAKEHPVTVRYRPWEVYEDRVSGDYHIAENTEQLGYSFSHSSFGLTQVCRKLRDEYLPVLRLMRHVRIRVLDLDTYMGDFVPCLDDNVPLLRAPGIIELTPDPNRSTKLMLDQFVEWTKASKKLQFRFGSGIGIAGTIVDAFPAWDRIGSALGFRKMGLTAWRPSSNPVMFDVRIVVCIAPIPHHAPSSSASSIDEERLVHITHFVSAAGFFKSTHENMTVMSVAFCAPAPKDTLVRCSQGHHGMGYSLSLWLEDRDSARRYRIPAQGFRNTDELENCRII
ncbi:hypothetical protein SLS60_002269 [Paraconiothyrium brasiliense]|uniref:Uncharacterized protein n=1 Tax=Paraconiothyrium brasiliense TaxID=300254 RepID=A0ABR3S1M7_9PLEO